MYEKVVVIGAPRSGTNMLRDMLAALPGVGTWPCDEINYIWRHGNVRHPSDAFTPGMATPAVRRYIRRAFDREAARQGLEVLVEKTCANSLRVGFVDAVVPDAKYVFIVRDGLDVVGSSLLRWKAKLDIPYLARKARYVPPLDLVYYGVRYFGNRVFRLFSREDRLAFWGPQLDDMERVLNDHSLEEVCALQWAACVDLAERDLAAIDPARVVRVGYEDFVTSPGEEFRRIARHLGREVPAGFDEAVLSGVSSGSLGKGREQLGQARVERLGALVAPTLERYGYGL